MNSARTDVGAALRQVIRDRRRAQAEQLALQERERALRTEQEEANREAGNPGNPDESSPKKNNDGNTAGAQGQSNANAAAKGTAAENENDTEGSEEERMRKYAEPQKPDAYTRTPYERTEALNAERLYHLTGLERIRKIVDQDNNQLESLAEAGYASSNHDMSDVSSDDGEDRDWVIRADQRDMPKNCPITYRQITRYSEQKFRILMREHQGLSQLDIDSIEDIRLDYKNHKKTIRRLQSRRRRHARRLLEQERLKIDLTLLLKRELNSIDHGIHTDTALIKNYTRLYREEEERQRKENEKQE